MLDTSKVDINLKAANEKEKEETEPKDKEDNTSLDEMVIDENFDTENDNNTGIFFFTIIYPSPEIKLTGCLFVYVSVAHGSPF